MMFEPNNPRIDNAVHDIAMLSVRYFNNQSPDIGDGLSDIAEALAFADLGHLRSVMNQVGTEVRDCIPDEAFETILELGGCDLSPTKYR